MTKTMISVSRIFVISCAAFFFILAGAPGWSAGNNASATGEAKSQERPTVDSVLSQVQAKYGTSGFCSVFSQVATLAGMGIQDTASGFACFKYPDKMRWEYEFPEDQVIVSNGQTLWVYRPQDNQALKGDPQEFFGAGEGASFLTDVRILKRQFDVDWAEQAWQHAAAQQEAWALKLIPKKQNPDFVSLYLLINKKSHEIFETASFNNFGDETRISFEEPHFSPPPEDSQFTLTIPAGVDIMEMSETKDEK